MKTIDRLTDAQVLALARFIAACARIRSSTRWRTQFSDCASRNLFLPFATNADQQHLRELVQRRGETVVCRLRTVDVMEAGNEVAQAWREPVELLASVEGAIPGI